MAGMAEELVGHVGRRRRLGGVAECGALRAHDLGGCLATHRPLVEADGDVSSESVVDRPQRCDDACCAGEQEGRRQTGMIAEELAAAADLACVQEDERMAAQRDPLDGQGIEGRAVDEDQAIPGLLGLVGAVHGEVDDIGGRTPPQEVEDAADRGIHRHPLVDAHDVSGLGLRLGKALPAWQLVDARYGGDTLDGHAHGRREGGPPLAEDPAPDRRLGGKEGREVGIERRIHDGELPRDVRLGREEQDGRRPGAIPCRDL